MIKLLRLLTLFCFGFICIVVNAEPATKPTEKLIVILDWFLNPDHAPLFVAEQQGFYKDEGLQVEFITPANPADPPKLVAAKKADIAVDYQPHLLLEIAQGLPLAQIGSLIDGPLSCLAVLKDSPIQSIEDLKGKRIGYASGGIDTAMLQVMLEKHGLSLKDVQLVFVGYGLTQALLSRKVDAVTGLMRNFELTQLALAGHPARAFYPEENGFPHYEELVLVARPDFAQDPRVPRFLNALKRGVEYLQAHPEQSWEVFAKAHPELNNELNRKAWFDTLPHFSKQPNQWDEQNCIQLASYLDKTMKVNIPNKVCKPL